MCYPDAALLTYCISYYRAISMFPLRALYNQGPVVHSSVPPIDNPLSPSTAEAVMCLIVNKSFV